MVTLGNAINVITRALILVAGALFLGWPGPELAVYLVDMLASLYAAMIFVLYASATRAVTTRNTRYVWRRCMDWGPQRDRCLHEAR